MQTNRSKATEDATNTLTVAYLRISTDGQEEGTGLDVQRQHIAAYAAANNVPVDVWLQDVESGAKEARPGLQSLRDLVGGGNVSQVLVYRLDRLARDSYLAEGLYREFSNSSSVVSVSESFGDGFTGNLMRQIVQAFAEYERAVISSRLKSGRREKARRNGTYSGGPGVFGYRPTGSKQRPGGGLLAVVNGEAEAVRLAFELRAKGLTLQAVADDLNRRNLKTMRGALFSPTHVHRILSREAFYRGLRVMARSYDGVGAAHKSILQT